MKLTYCKIRGFRNIEDDGIYFSDGVNLITGDNAQGKTSILEAVYVFARGRSFRTNKEADFIGFDKDGCKIEIEYEDKNRKNSMTAEYSRLEKRKLFKNGVQIRKTSEFLGNFRAVLFTPDHLSLIKESASDRRLFLDVALSQITPSYINYIRKYNLLLSERNALLKTKDASEPGTRILFETLAEQMAPLSATVTKLRYKYCKKLSDYIKYYFSEMTNGEEQTEAVYESCVTDNGDVFADHKQLTYLYERKFIENLDKEIYAKTSLYGPQKDDINITLNGHSSRKYCSQGQQRSLAIAMKLAEGDISHEVSGEYPVYLLDDISGELDGKRSDYFLSHLQNKQIIITSANIKPDRNGANVITVKNGRTFQ